MKITDLRIWLPRPPGGDIYVRNEDKGSGIVRGPGDRTYVFLRIDTDEGLSGVG